MPWKVVKKGNKWQVVNEETGDVKGTHSSKKRALAQQRALYANVTESKPKSK